MRHLSIRLPEHLYQQLEQKSQAWGGIGISKTIQLLLQAAIADPTDRDQSKYGIMIYTLLREAILSLVEDGNELIERATQRSE
jgi:metal-responsive CopG/Arc/MetJ family transcriptional regulator